MLKDEMQRMDAEASVSLIDKLALERTKRMQGDQFCRSITERHSHLFSDVAVLIDANQFVQMETLISAVEAVVNLPGWNDKIYSPRSAKGVFFGYDFHLNESGAHLIEINTNAGGAFLNMMLLQSQLAVRVPGNSTSMANLAQVLVEMFLSEWRLERGAEPLGSIAIVDEKPAEQYLYPEFILARNLFEEAGIRTYITDPSKFEGRADGIYLNDQKIDLIYNRLTDFSLSNYSVLSESYLNKLVVLTPNPQVYAQYADKRNLVKLTDVEFLRSIKVSADCINELQKGIPQTRLVEKENSEYWWSDRKNWFFKPVSGYGAKGAYRGDKITKRVFEDIISGDYVAQKLALPGQCTVSLDGVSSDLKYDVRCYAYDGKIQFAAARLYQGQTTNFRTPGGGFSSVRIRE